MAFMKGYVWSDWVMLLLPLVVGSGLVGLITWIQRKRNGESPDQRLCGKVPMSQPPSWVFAVVWPILYLLMGIVLMVVWRGEGRRFTSLILWFLVGIAGLQVWWLLFTQWCQPWLAFASLVVLAIVFIGIINRIWRRHGLIAILMIPLVAWLSFASYLSYEVAKGLVRKT
jgi:tryptophan-rich sensory protein